MTTLSQNLSREEYKQKTIKEFPDYLQPLILSYQSFVGKMKTPSNDVYTFADCKQKGYYYDANFLLMDTGETLVRFIYSNDSELEDPNVSIELAKVRNDIVNLIAENNFKWEEEKPYGMYSAWWNLTIEKETWNEDEFRKLWHLINEAGKLIHNKK